MKYFMTRHTSLNKEREAVSDFHSWDKIPEVINLKGGEIYFESRFHTMLTWLCCFGLLYRIHSRRTWQRSAHLTVAKKQREERKVTTHTSVLWESLH